MKYVIELGLSILLMAILANNLPSILKKVRRGQFVILKEGSTSSWGKCGHPQQIIKIDIRIFSVQSLGHENTGCSSCPYTF